MILEEEINNIINEELGISNEVVKLTNIIEEKVNYLIGKGIGEKVFNVKTDLSDVNVDYAYKEFNSEMEMVSWIKETGRFDGYSYQENTIYLTIYSINGVLNTFDLNDTIAHECNHYWECKKEGKTPYNDIYDKIANGITNWNPCISQMCEILYYCDKHEINSFVNGAFSSAMKKMKNYKSYKQFISDNSINDLYEMLKNARKTIEGFGNNNTYYFLAKFWMVSNGILNCETDDVGETVIKIAEISYNYLIKRIGKAYALYTAKLKDHQEKIRDFQIQKMLKRQGFNRKEKENGDI